MKNTLFVIPALALLTCATQAIELDTQRVSGQLFSDQIAEQAFAVDTLTRDEIAQMPVQNIADVLEWVAGIDVRQRGGFYAQTDVGIRGAGHEQTLILLDGVRLNHPQSGHHTFDIPIALEDIERIEVVRGPGAGQYGPNGNAGVINFVTRKTVATDNGRQLMLNLSGGSYGFSRNMLALAKTEGEVSQFANATYQRSDSYISTAELDTEMTQGHYRVVQQKENSDSVLSVSYLKKAFGAQGFYGPASARANEKTEQWLSYLTHEQRFDNERQFDVALSYRQHQDNFWYLNYAPSDHQVQSYQARLGFHANRNIAIGYEYNGEAIDSNSLSQGNNHSRDYHSVFSYGHYDFHSVQFSGSLSYLAYQNGDAYTLPVLGVVVPLGKHQLYANAGQSIRVPTLNDMYLNQATNKGNLDLKPEETTSAEIGTRLLLGSLQTRLAVFTRNTDNAIDFTQTAAESSGNVYTARNIENLDTQGVDVELDASRLLAAHGLYKASLSYSRLWQEFTNPYAKNKYAKEQLEHQAIVNLGYALTHNLSLSTMYKYERRYDKPAYFIWDLGLKQQFQQWHWELAAQNILNEKYIDSGFIRAPGTLARVEFGLDF